MLHILFVIIAAVLPASYQQGAAAQVGSALPPRMPMSSGAGGTFWVDNRSGSDSNPGTRTAPFASINHALETVPTAGSIINVRPGVFTSVGTRYAIVYTRAGTPRDPITVRAETPGTVVIRNGDLTQSGLGAWIFKASGLRLQGLVFNVTAEQRNIAANDALVENSDRIEFYRCTFQESGGFQVRGGMKDGDVSEDIWMYANTFRPSTDDVFAQATGNSHTVDTYSGSKGSHYIYAGQVGNVDKGFDYRSGAERFVVANNLFVGTASGRHVELGPQARNSFVVNNTFYGNHAGDLLGWDTGAAFAGEGLVFFANTGPDTSTATRHNMVANNLFVELNGHAVYGSGPSETGNVVQDNLSWKIKNALGKNGSATDDYANTYGRSVLFGEGTGNFPSADPLFADPAGFDFQLRAGSPAIDVANLALAPRDDYTGAARDARPDLGALEH